MFLAKLQYKVRVYNCVKADGNPKISKTIEMVYQNEIFSDTPSFGFFEL